RIDIRLRKDQTYAEVRITDNGKGISREDEEHIFQPYFTTRSKGTGLGLAIVKNLITEAGGDIRFVSEEGNGTTFILRFPLATGNKL
ncbi:MAG TPA: ATP-binding protein, partial [Bacteroidetes bacterium]|nr:ATP-binding protein [Bacteroidota bacterium]